MQTLKMAFILLILIYSFTLFVSAKNTTVAIVGGGLAGLTTPYILEA
jgi:ribulose 1,5-bisphosphate synthetase/thiazole synthase